MKVVCITNDVEPTTIEGDAYNKDVAENLVKYALPKMLSLYEKYNVKATMYCLASYAKDYPEIVQMIERAGHEVGCHALVHDSDHALDVLSNEEQLYHVTTAKQILDSIAQKPVVSFRAPALRVNSYSADALVNAGYKTDSSVAPQRLDMFMSFGSKNKLQWLKAPRTIYHTSEHNLARKGSKNIVEVPLSALGFPYISTFVRISDCLTKLIRWCLWMETKKDNKKVICYLSHPDELLPPKENYKVVRRTKNPVKHFFAGILRVHLKKKNLGERSYELLEEQLKYWTKKGYIFMTVSEAARLIQ